MRILSSIKGSVLTTFMVVSSLHAQTGKQQYQTYCAACHGMDGRGNDNAPSLAESEWVQGKADRSIKILLHGLKGKLTVKGKDYDLVMPPQGEMLSDKKIASILSYVRTSWKNNAEKVTEKQVSAIRAKHKNRNDMWSVDELLKAHPLPKPDSLISNMLMATYSGKWKKLPDFSKLESLAVEEEHKGLITLKEIGKKHDFGAVWTGDIAVPASGKYKFELDSDDGSALYIGGKKVCEVVGEGPMGRHKQGVIELKKGTHDFKLEFFQSRGGAGINLWWSGPGIKGKQWLTEGSGKQQKKQPGVMLTAGENEASMYRIFVKDCSPRAIAVAYPQKVNLVFSQDYCNYELFWQKDFIRANHWVGRGTAHVPPAGSPVVRIMKGSAFPESLGKPKMDKITFNKQRYPTFHYTIGDIKVEDFAEPSASGFVRHIKITSNKQIDNLSFNAIQQKIAQLAVSSDPLKPSEGKDTAFDFSIKKGTTSFIINYTFK